MAYLIPVPGRVVLLPGTMTPMDPAGMELELTAHWQQRLHTGDVSLATTAADSQDQAAAPARGDATETLELHTPRGVRRK